MNIKDDYLTGRIDFETAETELFEYASHKDAIESNNQLLKMWKSQKKMTNQEMIECVILLMNFLIVGEEEIDDLKDFNTPSNLNLIARLKMYDLQMWTFTEKLRLTYFPELILWKESPKEFFGNKETRLKFFLDVLNILNK